MQAITSGPPPLKAEIVNPHPDPLMEKITQIMDNAIPLGGGFSVGLDPILGLIPGIGDVIGAAISAIIIVRAARAGVPRAALTRMVANVAIDTLGGSLPIVGDAFDFAWKSNEMNMRIYRESLEGTRPHVKDQAFVVGLLIVLAAILMVPILLAFALWHFVMTWH